MEEMMRSTRARGPHSLPSKWTVYSRHVVMSMAIFALALAATGNGAAEAAPSPAQKCAEAKLKATGEKAKKKLECHAKAVKDGVAVDPDCLAKAETEFEKAFDVAEAKGGCTTTGDKDDVEATVNDYVTEVVAELPDGGTESGRKCAAAKLKATGEKAKKKLECHAKAVKDGVPVDPDCLAKAETEFEKKFDEAEAKGGCFTTGDADAIELKTDTFAGACGIGTPDGAACDDGNACTTGDTCSGGVCAGVDTSATDCDSHNVCITDSCNPASGCVHTNNANSCDDSNACTTGDTCSGGTCVGGPAPNCEDNNACTTDTCDAVNGCQHAPISCDDGNVCTNDSCNPATGCVHYNNTYPCDDNNACTTNDTCSGGSCQPGAPLDCDSHNVCITDSCNPATGCVHTNNYLPCDDNNACTTGDTCSGGVCAGVDTSATDCEDNNACTTDSCDSVTGCINDPITACVDDDGCCPSGCNTSSANLDNDCPAECGNGSVEGSEECDDGVLNSDTTPDACRTNCLLPYCGDGVVDTGDGEDCDGTNLNGEDCTSQGFTGGGTLACDGLCNFDTSNCTNE